MTDAHDIPSVLHRLESHIGSILKSLNSSVVSSLENPDAIAGTENISVKQWVQEMHESLFGDSCHLSDYARKLASDLRQEQNKVEKELLTPECRIQTARLKSLQVKEKQLNSIDPASFDLKYQRIVKLADDLNVKHAETGVKYDRLQLKLVTVKDWWEQEVE